jgi:hypothetical protein
MKHLKRFEKINKFHIDSYVARKHKKGLIYIIEKMEFVRNAIWIYQIKNIDTNMHIWATENSLRDLTEDEKIILDIKKYNI